MAKTKEPKAPKKGKEPKAPKAGKGPKVKKAKVKGRLLDKVTNLVVVLFGLSLVTERLVAAAAAG